MNMLGAERCEGYSRCGRRGSRARRMVLLACILGCMLVSSLRVCPSGLAASDPLPDEQRVAFFRQEDLALCPLREGDSGDAVYRLQFRLRCLGYRCTACNGSYDATMNRDVAFFQHQNGLEETGVADEATLLRAYALTAPVACTSPDVSAKSRPNEFCFVPARFYWYLYHQQMEALCLQGRALAQGSFCIHPKMPGILQLDKQEEYPHALPLLQDAQYAQAMMELLGQHNGFIRQLRYDAAEECFSFALSPMMGRCFVQLVYQPGGISGDRYGTRLNDEWIMVRHGAT